MRLICFLFFLFGFFSNSFVEANAVLDLDFYNPEEVSHSSTQEANYTVEAFFPLDGTFSNVTALGFPLLDGSNNGVTKVVCYSVKGLCQLAKVYLNNSDYTDNYFERSNTKFEPVQVSVFDNNLNQLRDGTYNPKLYFMLNLTNGNNPRGLFSVEENVDDGVVTKEFTPVVDDTQLSKLFCGESKVFELDTDRPVKVTAREKDGNFVLVEVDTVSGSLTGKKFYTEERNLWTEVDQSRYMVALASLHPGRVLQNLTLDLDGPEPAEYQVTKDYDRGLTNVTYKPLPGFHLVRVKAGNQDLWSGEFSRAIEVLSVLLNDEVVSVRVTSFLSNFTSFHHFNKDNGKFVEATEKEFTDRLDGLRQAQEASRPEPQHPTPHALNLSDPSHDFDVKVSLEQGVRYRRVTPKDGVVVSKVVVDAKDLWVPPLDTTLKYLNVYLNKQGAPSAYMLYAVGPKNKRVVDCKRDVGDNQWWFLQPSLMEDHLKGLRDAPKLDHAVELNLGTDDVPDHTVVDEFSTLGVKTTSYNAEDQYFFSKVSWNGQPFFTQADQQDFFPVSVKLYKNSEGECKLSELGGFLEGGEYKTDYFEWNGSKFDPLPSKVKFNNTLDTLSDSVQSKLLPPPEPAEESEPEEEPVHSGEQAQANVEVYDLDTNNYDPDRVSHVAGSDNGYYFDSYVPKDGFLFGDVKGPNNFSLVHRYGKFVTLAKFYSVHGKFLAAFVKTVGSVYLTREVDYYYTFEDGKWNASRNRKHFDELLQSELRYSTESKEEHERHLKVDEEYRKTMDKLKAKEDKQRKKEMHKVEKERKKQEDGERVRHLLDKKTKLYSEMADFDKEQPPESEKSDSLSEDELEQNEQPYGEEKFVVESELVYYDFKAPKANKLVHTKDFQSNGLKALDATPVAGKFFHILSLNQRRVWVSTSTRRCTNLQLFYEEGSVVGAVLRVTVSRRGKLKTGEDYDYLFVTDGELRAVDVNEFTRLANVRFQKAALAQLSTL